MNVMVGNDCGKRSLREKRGVACIDVSSRRKESERKTIKKILIILFATLVVTVFLSSFGRLSDPVQLNVYPMVPREGEPLSISFAIRNFDLKANQYSYMLYIDGAKVLAGSVLMPPLSEKSYSHSYLNQIELGKATNFFLKVDSPTDTYSESLTAPMYQPYTLTSFVSFATFATSMASSTMASTTTTTTMASMTSTAYYTAAFGAKRSTHFNVGVIFSIVLIALLMHIEVTEPFSGSEHFSGRIRGRFNRLVAVLFIIFISMVFTQILVIIGMVM